MTDNTRKPVGDGKVVVRLTRKEARMGERIKSWFWLLMLWLVVGFLVLAGTGALSAGDYFSGVALLIASVVFFIEGRDTDA